MGVIGRTLYNKLMQVLHWNLLTVRVCFLSMYEHNQEEFEDTKEQSESVIRRTDNTIPKRKRTSNDLQSTTHKTEDRGTRSPLKNRMNSGAPEG